MPTESPKTCLTCGAAAAYVLLMASGFWFLLNLMIGRNV